MLDENGFPYVGSSAHNPSMCNCNTPVGGVCNCEGARTLLILDSKYQKLVPPVEGVIWVEIPYPVRDVQLQVSPCGEYCRYMYDPPRGSASISYYRLKRPDEVEVPTWLE